MKKCGPKRLQGIPNEWKGMHQNMSRIRHAHFSRLTAPEQRFPKSLVHLSQWSSNLSVDYLHEINALWTGCLYISVPGTVLAHVLCSDMPLSFSIMLFTEQYMFSFLTDHPPQSSLHMHAHTQPSAQLSHYLEFFSLCQVIVVVIHVNLPHMTNEEKCREKNNLK